MGSAEKGEQLSEMRWVGMSRCKREVVKCIKLECSWEIGMADHSDEEEGDSFYY